MQGWGGILLLAVIGVGFGIVSVVISRFLGPRNPTPEKLAAYECGMPPVGDARERQSVKFYLIAMIFLLFDIEVAFLYPWALAMRELSWPGLIQIVVFFLILLVGYIYIWRKGVRVLRGRVRQLRHRAGLRPGGADRRVHPLLAAAARIRDLRDRAAAEKN